MWSRLTEHLAQQEMDVVYSFEDIERIIGRPLPRSAVDHAAFWSNSTQNPYSRRWRDAGFRVSRRGLSPGRIRFERVTGRPQTPVERPAPSAGQLAAPLIATEEWSWEGRVQSAVVRHLAAEGWEIRRVADTASSEQGVDIDAVRGGERLIVEVKGYPTRGYVRGGRVGERKSVALGSQARSYFSGATLSGLLMRAEHPDARVVLAFPDVTTFTNLARRVAAPLKAAAIEVWLVVEAGAVQVVEPSEP